MFIIHTIVVHHPWRNVEMFDAIVSDPPYGVRAGAKKIIPCQGDPFGPYKKNGEMRYPKTEAYDMKDILIDLLEFASTYLVVGGRLVYWFPTIIEEYTDADIPSHPKLILISNSEQRFGKWARRLITMEKIQPNRPENTLNSSSDVMDTVKELGHANFRAKYFDVR